MLETLRIQNFKSWQDTGDIAFGSLTGFFGTNSSGKSSILQFLLMLKQTVESSDRSLVLNLGETSAYVELGTLTDVLHRPGNSKDLLFALSWRSFRIFWMEGEDDIINAVDQLSFSAKIKQTSYATSVTDFSYQISDISIGMHILPTPKGEQNKYSFTIQGISQKHHLSGGKNFSKPLKFYSFPNEAYNPQNSPDLANKDLINKPVFEFEELFQRIFYLGPLREYPSRLYIWAGETPQSVGNRGERAVAALLSSRNQGATIDMGPDQPKRTVEEHVAHWLKELGLIYSFKVQPIAPNRKEYEVRIQRTAESASVFLTDVGFGVSQILPVLVLLFYVPEGSTVILEQPEIHLHPAVQAGLADVFIDAIKRRKLQIVLESHSEHLLQRLQRRMAEFTLEPEMAVDPDSIKLYFTSIKAGRSELTTLDLDEYGNIRNWPEGFFGDTLGEAAAMMKAEMKRKLREQQS